MSKLAQIDALPDGTLVPIGFVREALAEERTRIVTVAGIRRLTIDMWVWIGTRNLCRDSRPPGDLEAKAGLAMEQDGKRGKR